MNMKKSITSGFLAILLLGTLAGVYMNRQEHNVAKAGCDAFMATQTQRWEKTYAQPKNSAFPIIGCIVLFLMAAVLYEATGTCIEQVLRRLSPSGDNQGKRPQNE